MKYPAHLTDLINVLKRLPGVGNKSAERFAFEMLTWPTAHLQEFAQTVRTTPEKLSCCDTCGCLTDASGCGFCAAERRDPSTICIIAYPRDAFSLEETGEYKGLYHVLGGLLSPMEGFGPDRLPTTKLKNRIESLQVKELVIALDSTLEGDATALFLKQELQPFNLQISRLAFGLPMGSSLDYVDGGTLGRAFTGRRSF
jgi:recombination protein RecR